MNALKGCCISPWSGRQLFCNNMMNTEGSVRGKGVGHKEGRKNGWRGRREWVGVYRQKRVMEGYVGRREQGHEQED